MPKKKSKQASEPVSTGKTADGDVKLSKKDLKKQQKEEERRAKEAARAAMMDVPEDDDALYAEAPKLDAFGNPLPVQSDIKDKKKKKKQGYDVVDEEEGPASSKSSTLKTGSQRTEATIINPDDEMAELRTRLEGLMRKKEGGKKLSNREKRELAKLESQLEVIQDIKEQTKDELSNFSMSQSAGGGGGGGAQTEAQANAKDIIIERFSINAYKKELFVDAELKIVHGRRYGLLGPNGQGKTTLLKHMAARELRIPSNIDILLVEQEVTADDTPAVEMVMRADVRRTYLMEREAALTRDLDADDAAAPEDVLPDAERRAKEDELKEVYDEMAVSGADTAEAKARKILSGLGFSEEMQEHPTKRFSGGWRMRISLARALFVEPTCLLLDEPTNHLDLNAVIWLEDYLQRWKNTLMVVSHDQDFLSAVVTDIIHLENQKLNYYRGDYASFKIMHAQKQKEYAKAYDRQQKAIKQLKASGKSAKAAEKAAAGKGKGKAKAKGKGGSAVTAELAEGELLTRPKEYTVKFTFSEAPEIAPPVIDFTDVGFRYGPEHPVLFKDVNFGIDCDSRVAIVGPNGVGKSTLLNLVCGDIDATTGSITRNRFLRIGRYSQHFVDILPMDKNPVEYLRSDFGDLSYQEARNILGRFGLEGHAHEIPITDCSGGQKARVVFANLSLSRPHILIMDEPTNHLDIESIDALCEALTEFAGGVVLVSHDSRLIESTNCVLWSCEDQNAYEYDGDFEDYKDEILTAIREAELKAEAIAAEKHRERELAREAAQKQRDERRKARLEKAKK